MKSYASHYVPSETHCQAEHIFCSIYNEFAYCSNFYAALYIDWIPVFNEVPCILQQQLPY